jgi:hypothetical protein
MFKIKLARSAATCRDKHSCDFIFRDAYYDETACSIPWKPRHQRYLRRTCKYTANRRYLTYISGGILA